MPDRAAFRLRLSDLHLIFEGVSVDEHTLWPGQFPQLWGHAHLRPAHP
jgi:hypothetical protein